MVKRFIVNALTQQGTQLHNKEKYENRFKF